MAAQMNRASTGAGDPPAGPGKSHESVGRVAKVAVATAREAGVDLPPNAQGIAASSIAQGVDPATIFAAQSDPGDGAPAGEDTEGAAVIVDEAAADPAAPPVETDPAQIPDPTLEAALTGYSENAVLTADTPTQAALDILTGVESSG